MIRATSGALFTALGVFGLFFARGSRRGFLIAAFLTVFGAIKVVDNLIATEDQAPGLYFLLYLPAIALLAAIVRDLSRGLPRRSQQALAVLVVASAMVSRGQGAKARHREANRSAQLGLGLSVRAFVPS